MKPADRRILSWMDCIQLARDVAKIIEGETNRREIGLYGVPRGGIPAALMVVQHLRDAGRYPRMVNDPGAALYIIDDIVDTGRTRSEYTTKHQKPFHALVDKTGMFKPYDSRWVVFPWEEDEKGGPTHNIVRLLEYIGEDPDREGLKDTPERVIRAYDEMFRGYKDELGKIKTTFGTETYEEMVLLRDIEFYSTCEHHMMPISGLAHVAYIPDKELLGLSKLARIVDMYSRRLQIQERLCEQITDALVTLLEPKGAACVIRANHMCVSCRGVNKQRATMTTASLKGVFRTSAATRTEFYKMIEQ